MTRESREEIEAEAPIPVEVGDVIDLHGFRPADVTSVVAEYLDLAAARGYRSVRLIHGRGIGVQREAVRRLLARHPRVVCYADAPGEAGGWGATCVDLVADDPPAAP